MRPGRQPLWQEIRCLALDYGFGDFGGLQSELGYSHRVSLKVTLAQERFAREER